MLGYMVRLFQIKIPNFQPPVPGTQPGDPLSSPSYKEPQGAPSGFVPGDRLQARMERRSIGELYGEYVYNKLCD